jgi:hypothetical protein
VLEELEVPLARPRSRRDVVAQPEFAKLEQHALEVLGA